MERDKLNPRECAWQAPEPSMLLDSTGTYGSTGIELNQGNFEHSKFTAHIGSETSTWCRLSFALGVHIGPKIHILGTPSPKAQRCLPASAVRSCARPVPQSRADSPCQECRDPAKCTRARVHLVLATVRGALAHAALLVHGVKAAVGILVVVHGVPDGKGVPAGHGVL
jgi:hypothetical protein